MKQGTRLSRSIVAVAVAAIMGGCAVVPTAMSPVQRAQLTQADLQAIFGEQEPVSGPLTLHQAMARAVRYNLDQRVELMAEALARGQLDVASTAMLPQLAVNAGYSRRSNDLGSSSRSLLPPFNESLVASTSQDRELRNAGISMVWNVLDFGVSHAMAKQQADEVLIAEEKRRKVVQNIIQDVRYAYWRAVSAQNLLGDMKRVLRDLDRALERSEKLQALGLSQPKEQLSYRKSLLEMAKKMWELQKELSTAETELAALVNLPPGQPLELADTQVPGMMSELDLSVEQLEAYALANRPELREEHYRARISAQEVRKATLRMLPGLEISLGSNYDSNSYAWKSSWTQLGVNLSWNLFNLVNGPRGVKLAEANQNLDDIRRYAMSMAVMTQVNLANIRMDTARREYKLAYDLMQVESKLLQEAEAQRQADSSNELAVLKAKTQALVARMHHMSSYAEMQNALGRVQHSLGLDPLPADAGAESLDELAKGVEQRMQTWRSEVAGQ